MAAGRIVLSQYFPARDRNGLLVAGARLFVYENQTTTKAAIYADAGLATPIANPVVANASGQFPAIWASDAADYTLSITGPTGVSIGNPSVFDNYSVSIDADTAAIALSESAASASQAYYEDILALADQSDPSVALATRAAKTANLSDLADKAAGFGNLLTSSETVGFVPSSPNLTLEKAPVDLMDMLSNVRRQDLRDGTPSGDYAPYLQAQLSAMVAEERNGTLPATPTALRLETAVIASLPERGTSSMVSSFEMIGRGMKNSVFVSHVAGGPALTITHDLAGSAEPGGEGYVTSGYVEGLILRGFGIRSALGGASDGIKIENAFNPIIEAVEAFGFHGKGLEIAAFADPDIDTTSMPTIRSCRLQGNDYGLYIAAQTSGALAVSQGLIEHNWILSNRKDGIYASGFDQLRLLYNAIQANGANAGANDRGGMHVVNFGTTPKNLFMQGNEWGNGNRAHSLKIDGIVSMRSFMDRWVTNSAEFDYPTPVSIIMGDGASVCRSWTIERPQIVCHPSVPHTFLQVASTASIADNSAILDPDLLEWGAGGQTLVNTPSKVTEVRLSSNAAARSRSRSPGVFVVNDASPLPLNLDDHNLFRVYVATGELKLAFVNGGAGGVRPGETFDLIIENRTTGDITVTFPANIVSDGFTPPAAERAVVARMLYHPLGKFVPLGGWSEDIEI